MAKIHIRKMIEGDLKEVMEIEKVSFSSPWSRNVFAQEVKENRYAHYFVLEDGNKVVGYAGMWIVIDDAQVTNIAIHPNYRGKKLGEKLFGYLLQYALHQGVVRLSLEVRVSNLVAQRMYRKFGLVPAGIRKNYYTDNQEDALIMWVNLL